MPNSHYQQVFGPSALSAGRIATPYTLVVLLLQGGDGRESARWWASTGLGGYWGRLELEKHEGMGQLHNLKLLVGIMHEHYTGCVGRCIELCNRLDQLNLKPILKQNSLFKCNSKPSQVMAASEKASDTASSSLTMSKRINTWIIWNQGFSKGFYKMNWSTTLTSITIWCAHAQLQITIYIMTIFFVTGRIGRYLSV